MCLPDSVPCSCSQVALTVRAGLGVVPLYMFCAEHVQHEVGLPSVCKAIPDDP